MPPITPPILGDLAWRVARNCSGGSCVRVAPSQNMILIGDSKHPHGLVLAYSRDEWAAFARGIREGDFDDLLLLGVPESGGGRSVRPPPPFQRPAQRSRLDLIPGNPSHRKQGGCCTLLLHHGRSCSRWRSRTDSRGARHDSRYWSSRKSPYNRSRRSGTPGSSLYRLVISFRRSALARLSSASIRSS